MRCVRVALLLCAIVSASLRGADAASAEEVSKIKEKLLPLVVECGKDYNVNEETLKAAHEAKDSASIDPCFVACMMKKIGVLEEDGKVNTETVAEKVKQYLSNEEDLKTISTVSDDCKSVNDKEVSDGEKGCDRAKLLMACVGEHKDVLKNLFVAAPAA